MNNLMQYLFESGICLLVFFTLYLLFLERETFYNLKRMYLLFSIIYSLIVPLLNISITDESSRQLLNFEMAPLLVSGSGIAVAGASSLSLWKIGGIIYFSLVSALFMRLAFNFITILKLYNKGQKMSEGHYNIILHTMNYPPFSFFRNIFLSKKYYSEGEMGDIIEHEKAHAEQLHSLDMVLAEFLIILQWFNPLAWLYKKLVTENHEFLADKAVLSRGFPPESYQLKILSQLFGIRSMPAAQNFNQSLTQKRLKMMEKSNSTAASKLKLFMGLPVAILLFYMFACNSSPANTQVQQDPAASPTAEVFYTVDEMAEPEGGLMAFRQYIAQNLRYPDLARKKGIEGTVYIQFIIDENGSLVKTIENSEVPPPPLPPPVKKDASAEVTAPPAVPESIVLKGLVVSGFRPPEGADTEFARADVQLLADEAIRVIAESDLNWKPAMKDGKAVKSAWTIPVQFLLQ